MASERVIKAALNRQAADRLRGKRESAKHGDFKSSDMAIVQDVYMAIHEVQTACAIAAERVRLRPDDPDARKLAGAVGTFGQRVLDAAHDMADDIESNVYDEMLTRLDAYAADAVTAGTVKEKKKK